MTASMDKNADIEQEMVEKSDANVETFDPAIVKRITWKFDAHILPWIFLLWLLAFIDRSNIGEPGRVYRLDQTSNTSQ